MIRRALVSLAVVALVAVVFPGCTKKKPAQPDVTANTVSSQAAAPATEVSPNPHPNVVDQTPDPLAGDLAEVNQYVTSRGLLGDVYFDFNKSELRTDARDRLAKNADWLKANGQFDVTIEGHCDERGTREYNLALGERRAAAARDYLTTLGVATQRMKIISYGKERPVCTVSAESCWSQNRRAHFLVSGRANVG